MPDIMILAQAVIQIFYLQVALLYKMPKSVRGDNSAMTSPTEKKKYGFAYFLC